MTATKSSQIFHWGFLVLLLWAGCKTVTGLVNTVLVVPQETTPVYTMFQTPNTTTNTSYGEVSRTFGCENKSDHCEVYCQYCNALHSAPSLECLDSLFDFCLRPFEESMNSLNNTDWCIWKNVRSVYNTFTLCTEQAAECLLIPWPNPLVEATFVNIHSTFFRNCPTEELSDPPPGIVFALVMTPICLIPIMVVLVVLKTKNGDGSS